MKFPDQGSIYFPEAETNEDCIYLLCRQLPPRKSVLKKFVQKNS